MNEEKETNQYNENQEQEEQEEKIVEIQKEFLNKKKTNKGILLYHFKGENENEITKAFEGDYVEIINEGEGIHYK
jgi:hypothetical protein